MNNSGTIYWTDIEADPSLTGVNWLAQLRQIQAFAEDFAARHRRGERCEMIIGVGEPPAGVGILSAAAWRIVEGSEFSFRREADAAQASRVKRRPADFALAVPARR